MTSLGLRLPRWLVPMAAALALLLAAGVRAQAPDPNAAAAAADAAGSDEATLRVFNRDIFTFRSVSLGVSPVDRARRAKQRIEEKLDLSGPQQVTLKSIELGTMVQVDGETLFLVAPGDVDKLQQETLEAASKRAAAALQAVIEATRESRSGDAILRSTVIAGTATAVMLFLVWALSRARRAFEGRLLKWSAAHSERLRIEGVELIQRDRLTWIVQLGVKFVYALLLILLLYEWLSLTLAQFPYTQVWGQNLNGYLFGVVAGIGSGILGALPGLATAVLIFLIARFVGRLLNAFFDRAQSGQIKVGWLDADVVVPTRRLTTAGLWLFALAMAYPYLPGSETQAFKGLSLLVGLMVSLGSSSLVAQAGSGLILTYTRTFREGEYVRIDEHEGTVTHMGMFATRIRTGLGEELTLSNSLILGTVTKNYSRVAKGAGFVLDTTVTIGYDTPWRQVHELLVQAALRTPGVLADPAPHVFQTSLSDFYPAYRLVCQALPSQPRPRAELLSALHANIQDLFNEYGVQIMSPHYFKDPETPKTVPKSHWFAPPAKE
jgi:small-conductance mechanosensitive channel